MLFESLRKICLPIKNTNKLYYLTQLKINSILTYYFMIIPNYLIKLSNLENKFVSFVLLSVTLDFKSLK